MKKLAALFVLVLGVPASAQYPTFGISKMDSCDKIERIKPNLILAVSVQLSGQVLDSSGAPIKGTVVELRLYESESKQTFVAKTSTDQDGYFNLGTVSKGRYRLLASDTRAFKQADWLECGNGDACSLPITLVENRTATRDSLCPVR
jgi:5-hydroxyisourate hydrolase-like protein (transthyretin family)